MFKKICLVVLFLQLFFNNAAFAQMQNSSSEEEAIKSVIMNQTKSWADRNYEGLSDAWAHEEYILEMYPGPFTYTENLSWDSVDTSTKDYLKDDSTYLKADFKWSDWNIRIFKDCAWAS